MPVIGTKSTSGYFQFKGRNVTDDLEDKAAEMLKDLTELLTQSPQLIDLYTLLRDQYKNDPNNLKELEELAMKFISKIPQMTSVVSDATKVLETYLSYRISKRQEEATKRQELMTEKLLKQSRISSYSTLFLALGTFALVLVTVLRR